MKRDEARKWTDKHLSEMEKHIHQIYSDARDELSRDWNAYMKRGEKRLNKLYNDYINDPTNSEALKKYQDALQNYTLRNKWYNDMVTTTTYRIAHVNNIALAYINSEIPAIYIKNYNQIDSDAFLVDSNWTLRNEHMVKNLFRDSLPSKEINYAKDMAWNKRQINNAVLQGVIKGESIPKISNRIFHVIYKRNDSPDIVHKNEVASVRTARTSVTGAENRGRYDRYLEYEERGLVTHKIWIATPDGRTRNWHLSMDGQEVELNKPFIDGHGNELYFPGDPSGTPDSIYNCRCTMRNKFIGVKDSQGRVIPMKKYRESTTLHEKQIAQERVKRAREG